MRYQFKPLGPEEVRQMVTWDYPAPYQRYNTGAEDLNEQIAFFSDPANGYFGIWENATFIGFCCFGADGQVGGGDYAADALDVGAGFRPDLVGHGNGAERLRAILDFGRQHFAPTHFRATIAAFNQRAQKACFVVGFAPVATFIATTNGDEYVVLMLAC